MILTQITILVLLILTSNSIFIHKSVDKGLQFCLSDDIPRHTLVKVDVKSTGLFKFQFKEGMIPQFNMDINQMAFTRSFTTQRYGLHYFCFTNNGDAAEVAFQITIGQQAGDYGSPMGGDDLVLALTNQAQIAEEFIGEIVKENSEGMEIMVNEANTNHDMGQYIFFTLVFGLGSMGLTFMQHKVIKQHLHSRKYI